MYCTEESSYVQDLKHLQYQKRRCTERRKKVSIGNGVHSRSTGRDITAPLEALHKQYNEMVFDVMGDTKKHSLCERKHNSLLITVRDSSLILVKMIG